MEQSKKRVAILGAGPSGLAAALALAETGDYEIHVYQAGWRAGGKCATGREPVSLRTLQNGSHYLFGCYENAFALIRRAYEIIEASDDPHKHRFGKFEQEFVARNLLVSKQRDKLPAGEPALGDMFRYLPQNMGRPGEGRKLPSAFDFASMLSQYALGFGLDLSCVLLGMSAVPDHFDGVRIFQRMLPLCPFDSSLHARVVQGALRPLRWVSDELGWRAAKALLRAGRQGAVLVVPQLVLEWLRRKADGWIDSARAALSSFVRKAWSYSLKLPSARAKILQRDLVLMDLGVTLLSGYYKCGLYKAGGFDSIDKYDLRAWLREQGALEEVVNSALVTTWYDAIVSYRNGEEGEPTCSASVAVYAILRALLTYKGAFAFQMRGEVGDSFIAPLVKALEIKGVKFHFFSRIKQVVVNREQREVERVVLGVQCEAPPERAQFVEVVDHAQPEGSPTRLCWPSAPLCKTCAQLDPPTDSYYQRHEVSERALRVRRADTPAADTEAFDAVISCLPCGVTQDVLVDQRGESVAASSAAWRACFEQLRFTESQALRMWFKWPLQPAQGGGQSLGWPHDSPILSGYDWPHSTWEDNSQARDLHAFPESQRPLTIATLFGPLSTGSLDIRTREHADAQLARARVSAKAFCAQSLLRLWPGMQTPVIEPAEIDWNAFVDIEDREGEARFDWQHIVANVGPNESYVLAEQDKLQYRLRADESGFANLYLAGDWTRNGLEVGSVEGAVMSGLKAARALSGAAITIVGGDDTERGTLFG